MKKNYFYIDFVILFKIYFRNKTIEEKSFLVEFN